MTDRDGTAPADVAGPHDGTSAGFAFTSLSWLMLGRHPTAGEIPTDLDLAAVAGQLARSREFRVETVEPAFEGTLDPVHAPISDPVRSWVRDALAIETRPAESRPSVLAGLLDHPKLALSGLDVDWSVPGLSDALRFAVNPYAAPHQPADLVGRLGRIARGLDIGHASGLSLGSRTSEFRVESDRISIVLSFADDVRHAAFARLDLGHGAVGAVSASRLHVDYGGGFRASESLELKPRGRTLYPAFIADPGDIRSLRWDIVCDARAIRIVMLSARAMERDALRAQASIVVGDREADWFAGRNLPVLRAGAPEPPAFRMSRTLTRHLGGHRIESEATYETWLSENEATGGETLPATGTATIDVMLLADARDLDDVRETLDSLRRQTHGAWRAHLAVTHMQPGRLRGFRQFLDTADTRVVVPADLHHVTSADALSAGLGGLSGPWMLMLRSGDILRADALALMAAVLADAPETRILYADHDHVDRSGNRCAPCFKPAFSPETLLGHDYILAPKLLRLADIRAAGGWRAGFEEASGYDLLLRVAETVAPALIRHIPAVLCHRPERPTMGQGGDRRARVRAVREHLMRRGISAVVEPLRSFPGQRVRIALPAPPPRVSIIIPTRDRADLLAACVRSILDRTDYSAFEIVVIDNASVEPATHALFAQWAGDRRIRVLTCEGPFNFSALNNFAVSRTDADIVGLVNNDVETIEAGWMTELVSWAGLPQIGCVGAKLIFPDGRIQHAGVITGIGGVAAHSHKFADRHSPGYAGRLATVQNVSAVTAACLFVRRATYLEVGGFDEDLAVTFNDVDFCLRVREAGYRNLFTPFAELYHHESLSRGVDTTPEKSARFLREIAFVKDRWGERLTQDPFYSPNLTATAEDFSLNMTSGMPRPRSVTA